MTGRIARREYLVGLTFCLLSISVLASIPSISRAYGATSVQINDKASCEAQPVAGTWLVNPNRCVITADADVPKDTNWTVGSQITLDISKEGTLAVAGTLNGTGGSIFNEGILNISKDASIQNLPLNNTGTVNNAGFISALFFTLTIDNSGNITNTGTISSSSAINNHPGGRINNTGNIFSLFTVRGFFITGIGSIDNMQGSTFDNYGKIATNDRTVLNNTGSFINHPGGLIGIGGTLINSGEGNFVNFNGATIDDGSSGSVVNECPAVFTNNGTIIGNPVIIVDCTPFPPPPPPKFTLTVNAIDRASKPVQGVWTTIRATNGTLLDSGFTPISFEGVSGVSYNISVSDYDGKTFMNWQDGGGADRTRTIIIDTENRTITAVFDTGNSLRGFTSLTYTGTPDQPDLTVNATTVDGSKTLHMWTIIDPQSNEKTTTYKVYASNYKDIVFDHWGDGNKDRIRMLTVDKPTTITAYYKTGISTVSFAAHYHDVAGPGTPVCDDIISGTCGPFFGNSEKSSGVVSGTWFEGLPRGALCGSGGPINELNTDGATFEMTGTYTGTCDFYSAGSAVIVSGECGPDSEISFTIGGVENRFIGDSTCSVL